MAQNSIASELNDLLITRDFDVNALSTRTGKPAVNSRGVPDTNEADMFSFDWIGPTGKNYGTMVILLDQSGGMTVYFGDNLGRTMDPEDKLAWYGDPDTDNSGFLEQLKNFAIRTSKVRGGFSLENMSRLKYAIAGQAALTESFYGTRRVSYSGLATEARLMIKHSKVLDENDARFRYVESLFIETALGERFRLPFRKLSGGRAMLEHVRQGGNPYDFRGQHISETVSQITTLSQFRRAHQGRVFEGAAADLITETNEYYHNLNRNLKNIAHHRGYAQYFESWKPAEISETDMVVEDLKGLFTETRIDPRIESALPMLAKIQQEAQIMKEADIFESWANNLVEGTWALPDTPEKMDQLKMWLSEPHPVGPDASDAKDVLGDFIGDDNLFDQLEELAEEDPDADAVPLVMAWIDRNRDGFTEIAELAQNLEAASAPAPQPAPQPAAPVDPAAAAPVSPAAPVAEDNVSPRLAGVQQTQHDDGTKTTDYQQGPLQATNKVDAQGRPIKSTVNYDMGVGKFGAEQDHVTGIRTTTATPTDPKADPNALLPTGAIAAARGVNPTKFAAFQAQQPGVVKEDPDTGMYESDLARIKSLASLKLSEAGESFGDAYLQKAASGAPGRWMISQDQAKAELARRAAGGAQTVSAPEPAASSEPFVPKDYQTKEPLTKGPDGKWYNKAGQERDGLRGYPLTAQGTAQFRSLVPPAPAAPVNEGDYTGVYESDLARIKSLSFLK